MQTQLTEDEQKARKKYAGLTRRQYNAKKFANLQPKARTGTFEISAIFKNSPTPQTAPFPNDLAAIARFIRLSSNPDVRSLAVIETVVRYANGKAIGLKQVEILSLQRADRQEFANGKQPWWETSR